jgi:hypothetical protein
MADEAQRLARRPFAPATSLPGLPATGLPAESLAATRWPPDDGRTLMAEVSGLTRDKGAIGLQHVMMQCAGLEHSWCAHFALGNARPSGQRVLP